MMTDIVGDKHLGKCSKTPVTENVLDGGTPPLPITESGRPEKAGSHVPPSRKAAWNFFAENGIFCLKTLFLGQFSTDFFITEKGESDWPKS